MARVGHLLLDRGEPGRVVGGRRPGDPAGLGRPDRPFQPLQAGGPGVGRPEQGERRVPEGYVVPPLRDRGGGVLALEGQGVAVAPGVVAGQAGGDQAEPEGGPDQPPPPLPAAGLVEAAAEVARAVGPGVALLEGGHAPGQAGEVGRGEVPEPFELVAVDPFEPVGQPAERPFQAQRVQLGRRPAVDRPPAVRADGEHRAVGDVAGQGMPGHPVPGLDQPLDLLGRGDALAPGHDPVELGQEERHGPAHGAVVGLLDVALQEVLDLLLAAAALGRVGRAFGVEAEQDRVGVGEERLDRLVGAEGDVLALVILEDQVEPGRAVVKPELQLGLGQGPGGRLAPFDLGDLLGQVLGAGRVDRRQAEPGDLPGRRLAVEHRQQGRLAHRPVAEQRDPLRPGQLPLQGVEMGLAAVRHGQKPSTPPRTRADPHLRIRANSRTIPGISPRPRSI